MYTKSLIVCFFAYFFSILFGYLSLAYFDLGHLWLDILLAHIVATVVIFTFSIIYKNSSLYDPFWSVIPLGIGRVTEPIEGPKLFVPLLNPSPGPAERLSLQAQSSRFPEA